MTQQLTLDEALTQRDAVLELISEDPRNDRDIVTIAEAILTAARSNLGRLVTANDVRDELGDAVRPGCIGSTFHKLKRLGVLTNTGDWVPSTDRRSRNVGKPTWIWRLTDNDEEIQQ